MKTNRLTYVTNILMPCLLFSVITGVLTGGAIFIFQIVASRLIELSFRGYAFVRQNPVFFPALIGIAALLGFLAALLLRRSHNCRGGGIPTSVALLRGLIDFHWIKSVFVLFASAMLTYLGGVPLGNEGPSVQMGTAIGRGSVRLLGKKHRAWDRYIMTGGACAGFATATGAPVTGILFAIEEAHRRFSPMIFLVASMTVTVSSITMEVLCRLAGIPTSMFGIAAFPKLPLRFFWTAVVVGVICGFCALLFTKFYRFCRFWLEKHLQKMPFCLKFMTVFVAVAIIGYVSNECLSSGHELILHLLSGKGVWYLLILYFCVRAILLVVANNVGVTGGVFVPTLTFGAILGALCGQAMIAMGILDAEYYGVIVSIGMMAFLGASSRTPIAAIVFAVEALCGLLNILPVAMGVTVAFLVIECFGVECFSETVIEGKVEGAREGKKPSIIDTYLTVQSGAFVVGKEIRDILWPPTCAVLSIDKNPANARGNTGISDGDVLHLHYQTYDPEATMNDLEDLLGKQNEDVRTKMRPRGDNYQIPEL